MTPAPTRLETKAETTNFAARAIIAAEKKKHDAKTARLRAARLAKEAESAEPAPMKPKRAPRRRTS